MEFLCYLTSRKYTYYTVETFEQIGGWKQQSRQAEFKAAMDDYQHIQQKSPTEKWMRIMLRSKTIGCYGKGPMLSQAEERVFPLDR